MLARRVADLDFDALKGRTYHPSPVAWEDEVLYFLLVDRFSDGNEDGYLGNDGSLVTKADGTEVFQPGDRGNDRTGDRYDRGGRFVGGTLQGIASKLGYLQRLGVTTVWVSPVLRQVPFEQSYHGYGTQNFLEVESNFGTVEDLKALVDTAHQHDIRVVLDIILNHTGNVFGYDPDRYKKGGGGFDPRWDGRPYKVAGFHDATGRPTIPFAPVDLAADPSVDGGVWPAELYDPASFTQMGRIDNWDYDPEFIEGDFETLKNTNLGSGPTDDFQPSAALLALTRVYQYWLAEADLDGYRVDTVKHMELGATRFFASAIHEFAESIGKENFYLIAEITGGRQRAYETLEATGVDAALGIDDIPDKIEFLVKGQREPNEYFDLFRNSELVRKDSHVWFKNKVVTLYDDHDQVRKGNDKGRFCASPDGPGLALAALALNANTLGIPCVYYGSEQLLDGAGNNDRCIREAMFGGAYGPFDSRDRHVFREDQPTYRELSRVLALRKEVPALRRGRQYLRPISGDGVNFGLPHRLGARLESIVAWSRLFADDEVLAAINTDPDTPRTAFVVVDDALHAVGDRLRCRYSTDRAQEGGTVDVRAGGGKCVELTVPPGGFVVYE
jgi:glycosidase